MNDASVEVGGREYTFLMYPQTDGDGHQSLFRRTVIDRELTRDLYLVPHGIETPAGDGVFELPKERAASVGDATLTFLGFVTGNGEHGMTVTARVAVARGESAETLELPMQVTQSGLQATPVPSSLLGGARLVVLPGTGHLAHLEDPTGFNAAVRSFLHGVKEG